jgi:phage terminase small subunit
MADKLPAMQEAFVREYLVDLNATQAAIRAGYSEKTAHVQGPRLLGNVRVAAAITTAKNALAERHQVDLDTIVAEWVKIGFAEITDVMEWGQTVMVPVSPDDPEATFITVPNPKAGEKDEDDEKAIAVKAHTPMALIPSLRLSKAMRGAVCEVKQTPHGLAIKMHDKLAALERLYRHLAPEKAAGVNVTVNQLAVNVTNFTAEFDELLHDHLSRSEEPPTLDS